MDIKECYTLIGGDYEDVLGRLNSEKLITKIVKKYLDDTSFNDLKEGMETKNIELAFRGAHTLKGVRLNLGFKQMTHEAIELTEILRSGTFTGTEELFEKLTEAHIRTIEGIKKLD